MILKDNNCNNCSYRIIMDLDIIGCSRTELKENRIANTGDLEKICPCHSIMDKLKGEGSYIDDGLFRLGKSKMREIEDYIFGQVD